MNPADVFTIVYPFVMDSTWVDGRQRDDTAAIVMRYVDGEAALPTWRELGADWLLMYPKARLEQIYQEATGQVPGNLTRKVLAAGILDHATPGWLDQVPPELLVTEEAKSDAALVNKFRAEPGELEDLQAAAEELEKEEECSSCGLTKEEIGPLTNGICDYCAPQPAEEEGELA